MYRFGAFLTGFNNNRKRLTHVTSFYRSIKVISLQNANTAVAYEETSVDLCCRVCTYYLYEYSLEILLIC